MYRHTLYLHDALPILGPELARRYRGETIVSVIGLRRDKSPSRRSTPISRSDERFAKPGNAAGTNMLSWHPAVDRSEEHTSELQSLMRNSYAVFCLKKKKQKNTT